MALLQDPFKVLAQVEHYLGNQNADAFPGASLLSAGNLCRQIVEQIAFLLCVYGSVPKERFLKQDGRLKLLNQVLQALDTKDPSTSRTYWTVARRRGPRIAKYARLRAKLNKWRDWFNEPSHYSAPGHHRKIGEQHTREFVQAMRSVIDDKAFALIVAAYNEIMSDGSIRATLASDAANTPAISQTLIMRVRDIKVSPSGQLGIHFGRGPFQILPDDAEANPRKLKGPAVVRGQLAPVLTMQVVNEHGERVDLTNMETMLRSMMRSRRDVLRVQRRMRRLGFRLRIQKK